MSIECFTEPFKALNVTLRKQKKACLCLRVLKDVNNKLFPRELKQALNVHLKSREILARFELKIK